MTRPLVVKATAGAEDPERFGLALTVAATAAAAGVSVSLWLAAEAVRLALPGAVEQLPDGPGPTPADLLSAVLESGRVQACSQCLVRRGLGAADLAAGISVGGAAAFVAEVTAEGAAALVY